MGREVSLTAAELYFLGKLMKAKYIDYSYISAMEDIEKNYKFAENKAMDSLEKKGLISEDFGGDVSVNDEYKQLFEPVLFGSSVVTVELLLPIESGNCICNKFHFLNNRITIADVSRKKIGFSEYDRKELKNYLYSLAGELSENEEIVSSDNDIITSPNRVILIKYAALGEESIGIQINVCMGKLYIITGKGSFAMIPAEKYIELGTLFLGGEINGTDEF